MKPLPMPIRLAAGLVATALEEAQELPRKLTELPVTAVSQALQVSMRLQQRVTDLAIKGDRALGSLRPVPETPTWARFDEDEDLPARPTNGYAGARPAEPLYVPTPPKVTPVRILPDPEPEPDEVRTEVPAQRRPEAAEPTATGPEGLEEYEEWSLPQLRARFRNLSLDQLQALLVWETSHQDRPPFVTMLSNRIASVTDK
ncbi:lipid droplet-associated protein [Pseudonocardia spinosispora]|uniref:lipid droplet-associated protein n=1 Tax=Pseudonocardia spinosispora TaxID=103441 RepID=UPI00040662CB|nr:lipid droplet-associated protein [Pseudonocardia spinosispora]